MELGSKSEAQTQREASSSHEQSVRWFIPGYELGQAVATLLLRARVGDRARILVI
jgi:hypothetical protein